MTEVSDPQVWSFQRQPTYIGTLLPYTGRVWNEINQHFTETAGSNFNRSPARIFYWLYTFGFQMQKSVRLFPYYLLRNAQTILKPFWGKEALIDQISMSQPDKLSSSTLAQHVSFLPRIKGQNIPSRTAWDALYRRPPSSNASMNSVDKNTCFTISKLRYIFFAQTSFLVLKAVAPDVFHI